jgi:hypothetical protein
VAENNKIKRSRQILYVGVPGVNRRATFRRIVGVATGGFVSHAHPFSGAASWMNFRFSGHYWSKPDLARKTQNVG